MRVTPQDEMPARNASLLVKASVRGCVDESRVRLWPRTWLTARPIVPLLEDRIVSILSLLMKAPSRGSHAAAPLGVPRVDLGREHSSAASAKAKPRSGLYVDCVPAHVCQIPPSLILFPQVRLG